MKSFDDIYNELSGTEKFQDYFGTSKENFEQFVETSPQADYVFSKEFGVENITEAFKKKSTTSPTNLEEESFSLQSPSVGQTEEVVDQPEMGMVANVPPVAGPGPQASAIIKVTGKVKPQPELGLNQPFLRLRTSFQKTYQDIQSNLKRETPNFGLLQTQLNQFVQEFRQFEPEENISSDFNTIVKMVSEKYGVDVKPTGITIKDKTAPNLAAGGILQSPTVLKEQMKKETARIEEEKAYTVIDGRQYKRDEGLGVYVPVTPSVPLDDKQKTAIDYMVESEKGGSVYERGADKSASERLIALIKPDIETFVLKVESNVPANFFYEADPEKRQLSYAYGPYMFTERGLEDAFTNFGGAKLKGGVLPSVNPNWVDDEAEKYVLKSGIVTDELVKDYNDYANSLGMMPITKEGVVEKLKQQVGRLMTSELEAQIRTKATETRLAEKGIFQDEIGKKDAEKLKLLYTTQAADIKKFDLEQQNEYDVFYAALSEEVKTKGLGLRKEYEDAVNSGLLTKEEQDQAYEKFTAGVNQLLTENEEKRIQRLEELKSKRAAYVLDIKKKRKAEIDQLEATTKGQAAAYKKEFEATWNEITKEDEEYDPRGLGSQLFSAFSSSFIASAKDVANSITAIYGVESNPLHYLVPFLETAAKSGAVVQKDLGSIDFFSDEFARNTAISLANMGGSMVIPVLATMLTRNPYVGGVLGWGIDTGSQISQNYDAVFAKTGSLIEAENAAVETLKIQVILAPSYALEMLPFVAGALSKLSKGTGIIGFTKKTALGGAIENATEMLQETTGAYTQARLLGGEEFKQNYTDFVIENGMNTFANIAPATFILGAAGAARDVVSETRYETALDEVKAKLGELGLTQSLSEAVNAMGDSGINFIPEYLYSSKLIDLPTAKKMKLVIKDVVDGVKATNGIVQDVDQQKYFASLFAKRAAIERMITQSQDQDVKDIWKGAVDELTTKMKNVALGKDKRYTKIKAKGKTIAIVDNDEMGTRLRDKGFLTNLIDGKIVLETEDSKVLATFDEAKKRYQQEEQQIQEAGTVGPQTVGGVSIQSAVDRGATIDQADKVQQVVDKANTNRQAKDAQAIVDQAKQGQAVLEQLSPGVKIVLMNEQEFNDHVTQVGGVAGSSGNIQISRKDGQLQAEIQINVDRANSTTVNHEIAHVALINTIGTDQKLMDEMVKSLEGVISKTYGEGDTGVLNTLKEFIGGYNRAVKGEEFLVQLASEMANLNKDMSLGLMQQIAKAISDFVSKVTNGKVQLFESINKRQDFVDFMNGLAQTLRTGQVAQSIQARQAGPTDEVGPQTTPQATPQVTPQVAPETATQAEPTVVDKGQVNETRQKLNEEVAQNGITDVSLSLLENYAGQIENGTAVFERFSPSEQRGITDGGRTLVEATVLTGRSVGTNETQDERNDRQEADIEKYAKEKGIWFDDADVVLEKQYGDPIGSGYESVVWFDPNRNVVIKSSNTVLHRDLQEFLDNIVLHNTYFPESAQKVIGFGRTLDDSFEVITEQPFILEGPREATRQELDEYVKNLGFEAYIAPDQNTRYKNNDVIVFDVGPSNAIRTESGNIIPIDFLIRRNTVDLGLGGTRTDEFVKQPLTLEEKEIQNETVSNFVEEADETDPGIAVRVDPNKEFAKTISKASLGTYADAIFNGESFSNPLPIKTLNEIAREYEGRLFLITSDGTGYGIDSEGNIILGGIGFLTHPQNQIDGIGFASVDLSTVKSTISRIRKEYGNTKVAVLVMVQPPHTTINNSYGSHYFIRSMKELASNPTQLADAKASFKHWVLKNKDVKKLLNEEKSKKDKRTAVGELFKLIDSINSNTDVNEFTKDFLNNTTFDSRKLILQGLVPDKPNLEVNASTPSIKRLFLEKGFNVENFLLEYGDKTFLDDNLIKENKGGFLVAGFEMEIKPEEQMLQEIQDLQSKGIEHHLFNGKLPGTKHFALDGLYGVNENFVELNKPRQLFDYEKIAELYKNENLIPEEKPKKVSERQEGKKYASDKRDDIVRENFKEEKHYDPKVVQQIKDKFPEKKNIDFQKDILPELTYSSLKDGQKIKFKKNIALPMGILKEGPADVATDVARGIGYQPTKAGKEMAKTKDFVKGIDQSISKSQLNYQNIFSEYNAAMAANNNDKVASLTTLLEKGYSKMRITEQLGGAFDEGAYKTAQVAIAKTAMNQVSDLFERRNQEIKDIINANLGQMDLIYEDLIARTYYPLEIFRAVYEMDFMSPKELQDLFGADYRETIKTALNQDDYPAEFLAELSGDPQSIKIEQKAADILDIVGQTGIGLVDAKVAMDAFLDYLKENGFDAIAVTLRSELGKAKFEQQTDPNATWDAFASAFKTGSELFSMAGRVLQLARFFNERSTLSLIERSLKAEGVKLTPKQRETLTSLVNDNLNAEKVRKEKLKELESDWSDNAYDAYLNAEKAHGLSIIRVAQFLDARKPGLWNERVTSGGSRALLGVTTTVLSFVANVENNLISSNYVTRFIQKMRDSIGSGIRGNTLSYENWKMARDLAKPRFRYQQMHAFKYGALNTTNGLNNYYDNLAQVNFFKDPQFVYKFANTMVKKTSGKFMWQMTPEEAADALNLTLIELANGKTELRDGKTYTMARSMAWSIGIGVGTSVATGSPSMLLTSFGPQIAEGVGRVMAFGGDMAFGQSAAQRAMIDYFSNIQGTRFQDGVFNTLIKDAKGNLDKNALRALSTILFNNPELYAKFEEEGLKRTLLADNVISSGISGLRGGIRKRVKELYIKNRLQKPLVKTGISLIDETFRQATLSGFKKNLYQLGDVALWTLMPFTKVPVNFLGSALAKTIPAVAVPKYLYSEISYQVANRKFDEKYPKNVQLKSERQKLEYEKAKIDLFRQKRQVTFDAAQMITSMAFYALATSIAKAGALLVPGDDEKDKALKEANARSGRFNISLYFDYLKSMATFNGTDNFLARRGGDLVPGDVTVNIANFGYLGYALGLYGAAYEKKREKEQNLMVQLLDDQVNGLWLTLQLSVGSGIQNLPMFQGLARVGQVMNDLKSDDPEAGKKAFENYMSSTVATSAAVFFPSFNSFISKGNAEFVQNPNDIFPTREGEIWPATWGKWAIKTVQKLNRNVSFNEDTRNEYYKEAIGPFGENLYNKVTLAEPGTAGAYLQAMFDPFGFSLYSIPVKEQDKEQQKYITSMVLKSNMINLANIYQQMTGRDYEWKWNGKTSGLFQIITNPLPNKFVRSADATFGPDDSRTSPNFLQYELPNDLYREELKIRGELMFNTFKNMTEDIEMARENVKLKVENNNLEGAKKAIIDIFQRIEEKQTDANTRYWEDYASRERRYFVEMKKRNLLTPDMLRKMESMGFTF